MKSFQKNPVHTAAACASLAAQPASAAGPRTGPARAADADPRLPAPTGCCCPRPPGAPARLPERVAVPPAEGAARGTARPVLPPPRSPLPGRSHPQGEPRQRRPARGAKLTRSLPGHRSGPGRPALLREAAVRERPRRPSPATRPTPPPWRPRAGIPPPPSCRSPGNRLGWEDGGSGRLPGARGVAGGGADGRLLPSGSAIASRTGRRGEGSGPTGRRRREGAGPGGPSHSPVTGSRRRPQAGPRRGNDGRAGGGSVSVGAGASRSCRPLRYRRGLSLRRRRRRRGLAAARCQ